MPPVGVKVSLNTEMQKFLAEKTVTPSSGQNPRMTADSAQVGEWNERFIPWAALVQVNLTKL